MNDKLIDLKTPDGKRLIYFFCPGCKHGHPFEVPRWSFNENFEKPTFSPSLKVFYTLHKKNITTCHLFLKEGKIQFLSDCQHELKSRTVDLVDWPEGYGKPGSHA